MSFVQKYKYPLMNNKLFLLCFEKLIISMSKIFERFKEKWKIKSNRHLAVILLVFSLTGFSTLFLEELIVEAIGLPSPQSWWLRLIIFIFLSMPLYNILLLFWAFILGEFRFFLGFIKQFFGTLFSFLKKNKKD